MNVSARIHSGFNPATTGAHTAMRPNDDVADMHDAGSGIEESRAPAVAKQAAADRRTELISKMLGSHEKSSREVIGNMGGDGGGRKEPTKPMACEDDRALTEELSIIRISCPRAIPPG